MRSVGFREELILALPCAPSEVPLATRVRGTLLGSSTQGIRDRHLQDEYFAALDPQHHDTIHGLVPSTWLPIEIAIAHYAAIDSLQLPTAEQWAMGRRVAERVQHGWVGTVVRGLKATGAVSPVQVMGRFQNAWDRLIEGGAGAVYQTGPKDMRVEGHGLQLAPMPYFRNAWGGMFESTLELIARKVYVSELPTYRGPTTCGYSISWV